MLRGEETSNFEHVHQSDCLAEVIEQVFPALRLVNRRVELSGGDHVLLIVDDHFVFRFPRHGMHDLDLEIAVLKQFRSHSPIATPIYEYVDPAGRFAGYSLIKGSALTPACFAALPQFRQYDILKTAALFLAELHALPADKIAPLAEWPVTSTPAEFADHGLTEYLPKIIRHLPDRAHSIKAFYNRYRQMTASKLVVIHGDLVAEHILLDEQTGRLGGIIDFGDVALGDPAQDFLGFWAYGADAARQAVGLYAPSARGALFERSRDHFIRYRLDRIIEGIGTGEFDPVCADAQIAAVLTLRQPGQAQITANSHATIRPAVEIATIHKETIR